MRWDSALTDVGFDKRFTPSLRSLYLQGSAISFPEIRELDPEK